MNTAVNKATRKDGNVPKQKHVTALCSYSWETKVTVANMLDLLADRLREKDWDVVFKALLVIHTLMRDGCSENVFGYLALSPGLLDTSGFRPKPSSSGVHQVKNIRSYASYLEHKVIIYHQLKIDLAEPTKGNAAQLMQKSVEGGLLDHVSMVKDHLEALLRNRYHESDIDNNITLLTYKYLIRDLLAIYQLYNQGTIHILKLYFQLTLNQAKKALEVYKNFIKVTTEVVEFLKAAKNLEFYLGFIVPELTHAPVSLLDALQEHIRDIRPDSKGKNSSGSNVQTGCGPKIVTRQPAVTAQATKKDAMDFFASLDDELKMQNYHQPSNLILPSPSAQPQFQFNNPMQIPTQSQQNMSANGAGFNPFGTQPQARSINQSQPQMNRPVTSFNPFQTNDMAPSFKSQQPYSATLPTFQANSFNSNQFGGPPAGNTTTNPFFTLQGNDLSAQPPQQLQANRNTLNPFLMDANPNFNQANANNGKDKDGLSNLFNQHSFN